LAFSGHRRGEFFPSDGVNTNRVFTKPCMHKVYPKKTKTA
jgi:hypothetical protein